MELNQNKSNLSKALESFSQGQIFGFGILCAVLVIFALGFLVMIGMVLNGSAEFSLVNSGSGAPKKQVVVNSGSDSSGNVQVSYREVSSEDHVRGSKNAKVTLIEYSDFECPACGAFEPSLSQASEYFKDKLKVVYRHFPLESIHPKARMLANASECAAEQGKFWEMHDKIFADQSKVVNDEAYLGQLVTQIGLNKQKFDKCLADSKFDSKVTSDATDAESAGCGGTPCSVIVKENGQTIPVNSALPFSRLKPIIESALQ